MIKKISVREKIIVILLAAAFAFLPLLTACGEKSGGDDNNGDVNNQQNTGGDELQPVEEYEFPDVNYNGAKFRILNTEQTWDFTTVIVPEELAGEQLNDAIFNRNMFINDKFNIELEEVTVTMDTIEQKIKTSINSGVYDYDAIYSPGNNNSTIGSLILQGSLIDLTQLPELNLESPWWNQDILEEARIGAENSVFFASNDVNIMTLQGAWVTYFNEDMMQNLGLEKPYQLVRDGKWTLAQLEIYMKSAVNLNSEASFTPYKVGATSIYGLLSYEAGVAGLLLGSNARFITKDSEGTPVLTANDPHFINACQKIADILAGPGMYGNINDSDSGAHYEKQFMADRSLFVQAEIKACSVFRTMESNFGVLPTPKFDENQEKYANIIFRQAPLFVLPVTIPVADRSKVAIIMDALSYVSYRDVTPVFFDVSVSQKGLRNEESIEMLNIIRSSSVFDTARIYDWVNTLDEAIRTSLAAGNGNVVSTIEKNAAKIEAAIQKTLTGLDK